MTDGPTARQTPAASVTAETWDPVVPHLGVEQVDPLSGLQQLLLCQLPAPLCLLQCCPQLLHLRQQQVVAALQGSCLLLQVIVVALSVIQLDLQVLPGNTGSVGTGGRQG